MVPVNSREQWYYVEETKVNRRMVVHALVRGNFPTRGETEAAAVVSCQRSLAWMEKTKGWVEVVRGGLIEEKPDSRRAEEMQLEKESGGEGTMRIKRADHEAACVHTGRESGKAASHEMEREKRRRRRRNVSLWPIMRGMPASGNK